MTIVRCHAGPQTQARSRIGQPAASRGCQRNCADLLNHEQNPAASLLSAVVYRCTDGFIQPQGGGKDVFVHISAVERPASVAARSWVAATSEPVGRSRVAARS